MASLQKIMILIALALFPALAWGQPLSVAQKPTKKEISLAEKMQMLRLAFETLVPYLASESAFQSSDNEKPIKKGLSDLEKTLHDLDPKKIKVLKNDPLLQRVAQDFKKEVSDLNEFFSDGSKAYVRHRLQNLSQYCIDCHARTAVGPKLQFKKDPPMVEAMNAFDRGNFFLATRQYDRAQYEFQKYLLAEIDHPQRAESWLKAIQRLLLIAVRVNQDPDEALEVIRKFQQRTDAPYYVGLDAKYWVEALQAWKRESPAKKKATLANSRRLIHDSDQLPVHALNSARLIHLLRASAMLHEVLRKEGRNYEHAEAFLYLGIAYEGLAEAAPFGLDETYYIACIDLVPQTELSEKCFYRLESLLLGRAYHALQNVPWDKKKKLREYRKRALRPAKP